MTKNYNKTAAGAEIAAARKARGISQTELAQKLGIKNAILSHYERGVRVAPLHILVMLEEYIGLGLRYIIGVYTGHNKVYNAASIKEKLELNNDPA